MSKANFVIEGFAAEPRQRTSQQGKHMLDISVAHSPRRRNKQSGEWEDVTDQNGNKITIWGRATFFDDMAKYLATTISKGLFVRLEGEPRVNAYINNDGQAQASIDIQFASISVVPIPPKNDNAQQGWAQPSNQGQPAPDNFGGGFDPDEPF